MALINQLNNLGDAVRERTATTDKLTLEQMAEVIKAIPYPEVEETTITENGVYEPTGDGFSKVTVEVPSEEPVLQFLDVTKNGEYYAPEGVHGFNPVFIDVPEVAAELGPITITENGTYRAGDYELHGFKKVFVEVPIPEPEEPTILTLEVDQNGEYYAPEGVHGYNPVIVDVSVEAALGPLTVTENGTYKADAYDLDGFKKVIVEVPTGGGGDLPAEALTITGDVSYRFANNGWNWFIEEYGNQITTNNITTLSNMFYGSGQLKEIPFAINAASNNLSMIHAFNYCTKLEELPEIYATKVQDLQSMCNECKSIRTVPESWCEWDLSELVTNAWQGASSIFNGCYSLRSVPVDFLKKLYGEPSSCYSSAYYYLFNRCYSLDAIKRLGVSNKNTAMTSNAFMYTFDYCGRLKNVIFDTQEEDVPFVAKWSNQTIDLSVYVGYLHSSYDMLRYNSGITADKEVFDDASYQALKDDPDWFTTNMAYSRYNHDSAVKTIASLPDCSATGTNIIKFRQLAGQLTDGGQIGNLTEEEIAIAAAKGWTVSFV